MLMMINESPGQSSETDDPSDDSAPKGFWKRQNDTQNIRFRVRT